MKTKNDIKLEIKRLKKKLKGNKEFLKYKNENCDYEQLVKKHNSIINKKIKVLEWVLN